MQYSARKRLEARVKELEEALVAVRDDLLLRSEVGDDDVPVVNMSNGVWHKVCGALRTVTKVTWPDHLPSGRVSVVGRE